MRNFKRGASFIALLIPQGILAQGETFLGDNTGSLTGASEGWAGFGDTAFILSLAVSLLLATVLSAFIGFHPRTHGKLASPSQLEKPKADVFYGVIGAVVGILVLKYGPLVGLVIFGIGGLLRFRTNLGSPLMTGKAILITLIGLCCGMNLPHVAILVTAFGFILIYLLERREIYQIRIKGLEPNSLPEAAQAYRQILTKNNCTIIGEAKNFVKSEVRLVFSSDDRDTRGLLEKEFLSQISSKIRGSVDWSSG